MKKEVAILTVLSENLFSVSVNSLQTFSAVYCDVADERETVEYATTQ